MLALILCFIGCFPSVIKRGGPVLGLRPWPEGEGPQSTCPVPWAGIPYCGLGQLPGKVSCSEPWAPRIPCPPPP